MSMIQPKTSAALTPRTTLIAFVVFVLVTAGVILLIVNVQTGSSGGASAAKPHTPSHPSMPIASTSITAVLAPDGLDYSVIVKRNLFQPLFAPTPPPAPPPAPTPPPFIIKHKVIEPITIAPPLLAFTGVVEIAGVKYALLEDLTDHHTQYTRVGSDAFGYTLQDIGARSVTLNIYGTPTVYNIGDNKVSEKTTPPATAAPATDTTTTPGATTPGMGAPGTLPGGGNFPGGRYGGGGRRGGGGGRRDFQAPTDN